MTPRTRRLVAPIILLAALLAGVLIGTFSALLPTASSEKSPTASGAAYPAALTTAADRLDSLLAAGARGYRFAVLQTQVLLPAKAGAGITIQPDPSASPVVVDHLFQGGYLTQGAIGPGVFWMEIRGSIAEKDLPGVFATAAISSEIIERDGELWRNDGQGWLTTDGSPGLGIDRPTALGFSGLLRHLVTFKDLGSDTLDGRPVHHFAGTADAQDWRGIVASDGILFTSSPISLDIWLDADGNLTRLKGQAINLNETANNLVIETTIDFDYTKALGDVPLPSPAYSAPPPESPGPTPSIAPTPSSPASPAASNPVTPGPDQPSPTP